MVGDNTMRASRINSILNRYAKNIAKQKHYKQESQRSERLFKLGDVNASALYSARAALNNAMKRQYTRNQYMNGVTG